MTLATKISAVLRILTALCIMAASFAVPVAAEDTAATDPEGAIRFIEKLALDTKDVWSNANLTSDERAAAFREVFQTATDIELLSKAMLGRHYRAASQAQKAKYLETMQDYIITEFDRRMSQIGFKELEVTGSTPASGKRGHLFVRTQVKREEGDPILADWRVRKENGVFQIVNLEVEGINLLITNRELFSSRIKEVGLDGLIGELAKQSAPPAADRE